MKFLRMTAVATLTNNANVMQIVNVDKIETIVTAADTCIVNYKGHGTQNKIATLTQTGKGKAMGDALMNLLEKGHMTVYNVDAAFNGGVTTIAFT